MPTGRAAHAARRARVVRAYPARCLTAYVVSLKGAGRLLELATTIDQPIDKLVNKLCVDGALSGFTAARMHAGCVGQMMHARREPHQLESLVWNSRPWRFPESPHDAGAAPVSPHYSGAASYLTS